MGSRGNGGIPENSPERSVTAVAINNSGRIVGNLTTGFQTGIIQFVAVWDRGALTVLGDGTPEASALAVSDGGKVVGYDKTPVGSGGNRSEALDTIIRFLNLARGLVFEEIALEGEPVRPMLAPTDIS